eukprot:6192955-Pleurochrysis_carterae.AAC.4
MASSGFARIVRTLAATKLGFYVHLRRVHCSSTLLVKYYPSGVVEAVPDQADKFRRRQYAPSAHDALCDLRLLRVDHYPSVGVVAHAYTQEYFHFTQLAAFTSHARSISACRHLSTA